MENIKGKVVVITGASSGIGEATALMLAKRGAKVVIGARGADKLKQLAERIKVAGGEVVYLPSDVRKQGDVSKLVNLACQHFGRIDVLFSNAGVMPVSPLDDLAVKDWEDMVDIHIKGLLYGIAAALPIFRKQGTGHFINTASTAAHKTVPNQTVYSGTKYAVRAISEGLRQEAGKKIRVTVISPGFVNTNFADSISNSELKAKMNESRDKLAIPPEAVADAIAYSIGLPANIDVGEIIIRPTAQG